VKFPTFTIYHAEEIAPVMRLVFDFLKHEWPEHTVDVIIKRHSKRRSIDQNALSHLWYAEIAKFFVAKGKTHFATGAEINKKTMKENLKSTFLGAENREYEDVVTHVVRIRTETRHTAELDKGEMHHFMVLVDQWASEHGIPITRPVDSEYAKWAREMGNIV